MFEPQNHPDDIPYPGGPPTPPYDNTGWTLAYQMGVRFDRILDPFTGPFEKLVGFAPVKPGTVGLEVMSVPQTQARAVDWYTWSRSTNDAFAAVNRLLRNGQEVYTVDKTVEVAGRTYPAGAFFVHTTAATRPMLDALAAQRGVTFSPVTAAPGTSNLTRLKLPRVALWDVYGGEISSGWMRFVFDQFEFPYEVVFANDIDNGDLNAKYDVLILPDGANLSAPEDTAGSFQSRAQPTNVPPEYKSHLGRITDAKSLPKIRQFVEHGGTLLALASASEIGYKLGLPVANAIVDDNDKPLPRAKYYVPGSVLSVAVDTTSAIAWGMPARADIFYVNDPAFRLKSDARASGLRRVAWFDGPTPLRSGWAWGQKVLDGANEIVTAPLGKGTVVLYGPQVHFRGQTHGAFRFLFNGIYSSQLNR
jgi:hypothetical protein